MTVAAVAAAIEELTASVSGIAQQSERALGIAARADEQAVNSRTAIDRLSSAVGEIAGVVCQRRRKTRPLGGAKPGQYSRHAGKRREGVARAVLACVRGDFRRTVQADWPDFRALL